MKQLLLLFSIIITYSSFAQISQGGSPLSFNKTLSSTIPTYTTPIINLQPYLDEDVVTDSHKDIAWRFGIEQQVNLTLNNSGIWEILPNGDKVWRLEIKSPNALSINLNYNKFILPIGATFFVFNKYQTLGSFTAENNKVNEEFSTSLLKGDYVVLEYFEPANVSVQGIIEISSVVHGYRNLFNKMKAFGGSGACNINAICDSAFWDNEIRSTVMLLTAGNTRFCSGALINNVPQDGTPYILTANHCNPSTNNIFMFNYQSPNCSTNIDGNTTKTISGCTLRATDTPSDFSLVELSSTPPSNYNVFYAGWSNINIAPTKGTGIHHPVGDVKKISHDNDNIVESGYYTLGNDHWEVIDWDSGTTQGGSSGSPLFDQNHRIVGQLHGGNASCTKDAFDLYGKFSVSWQANVDTTKQLKHWLDPNNTGVTTVNGYDPNGANLVLDAVLLNIDGLNIFTCNDSIAPTITIRNNGSNNLTSLIINYQIDGLGVSQINWVGNLAPYAIAAINVPSTFINNGAHTFKAFCTNPNGGTDQNFNNDTATVNFKSHNQPLFTTLNLTTDNFGSETSWLIRDAFGVILYKGGGYQNVTGGQNITENICLYDSCFTFVLKDSYGDGFCCATGNGSILYTENATGDTLAINNTFNNDSIVFPFCIGLSTEIIENTINSSHIYPNPNSGVFTVTNEKSESLTIIVYDLLGQIIYQTNKNDKEIGIDISNVTKGIYFVLITVKDKKFINKIIVN